MADDISIQYYECESGEELCFIHAVKRSLQDKMIGTKQCSKSVIRELDGWMTETVILHCVECHNHEKWVYDDNDESCEVMDYTVHSGKTMLLVRNDTNNNIEWKKDSEVY